MPLIKLESFRENQQDWALQRFETANKPVKVPLKTFIFHILHEGFVGNVPIDVLEKFPGQWIGFTFSLTYLIFLGCYVGFFAWSYTEGLQQTFVSLDYNAGNCDPVDKPLTGSFLASSSGVWEGNAQFRYTDAAYQFTFNELTIGSEEFNTLITKLFSLSTIAARTVGNDMASNLLIWMHYRKTVVMGDKLQSMRFFSRPNDVFDRQNIEGGAYLNTVEGSVICLSQYTSFDTTTASAQVSFSNTTLCQPVINIMRGLARADGDVYRAKLHLNSFTSAAAINTNILSMDQLEVVQLVEVLELHGHSIAVKAMYDPSFTRANTFVCSDLNGSLPLRDYHKEVCLIDESSMLLLPIVTHIDEHCASCTDDPSLATVPCDSLSMIAFFIFFPNLVGNYTSQTVAFLDLYMRVSDVEMRKAVSRVVQLQNTSDFNALCPDCGVFWVHLFDQDKSVSPYRRQLPEGLHCLDSVTSQRFDALGSVPPASLTESYFVCRDTTYSNVINAVGLAFGNTSIFGVTFLALFLPVLFYLTSRITPKAQAQVSEESANLNRRISASLKRDDRPDSTPSIESASNDPQDCVSEGDLAAAGTTRGHPMPRKVSPFTMREEADRHANLGERRPAEKALIVEECEDNSSRSSTYSDDNDCAVQ